MRSKWIISAICCVVVLSGCKTSETTNTAPASPTPAAPTDTTGAPTASPAVAEQSPKTDVSPQAGEVRPKIDACALLTSDEIESVQGEPVKETKLSGSASGGFNVSQCFFTLSTFTNSVSLTVTKRGEGASARDPKRYWRETFSEKRERENEEEKESGPPQKVSGVGDQAFWMGSRIGGALYVLKGNDYVRISIGGPGDSASKIKKSKSLAQKALAKL